MATTSAPSWKKNVYVLAFGSCLVGLGFSLILPFLSLYISTLGNYSKTELSFWSGAVFAATYLVQMFVSPLWGKLADKKGRKLMILRASLGMGIVIIGMGCVTTAWQLFILRLLQGFFSGYVSNCIALVAVETPHKYSGKAMGILNTGFIAGQLTGPFLGGVIGEYLGYRISFWLTGAAMFIAFLLSVFFVHENFKPADAKDVANQSTKQIFFSLSQLQRKVVVVMLLSTMILQIAVYAISSVLSLYVKQLMNNTGQYTLIAGIIAAMPGIAMFLAASRIGEISDKIGSTKVLRYALLLAVLDNLFQSFASSLIILGILRFILGIADAATLPSVQTTLAKVAPHDVAGRIFAYNQSAQAAGMFIGPLLGSAISGLLDFNLVFVVIALVVFINYLLVLKLPDKITPALLK